MKSSSSQGGSVSQTDDSPFFKNSQTTSIPKSAWLARYKSAHVLGLYVSSLLSVGSGACHKDGGGLLSFHPS